MNTQVIVVILQAILDSHDFRKAVTTDHAHGICLVKGIALPHLFAGSFYLSWQHILCLPSSISVFITQQRVILSIISD